MKVQFRMRDTDEFQVVDLGDILDEVKSQLEFQKNDIVTIIRKKFWQEKEYAEFLRHRAKELVESRYQHFVYGFPQITLKEYARYLWWWQIVSDNSNREEGWKFALGFTTEEELQIPKFTTEGLPQDLCDLIA